LRVGVDESVSLALFLTAAMWLGAFAVRAGLAERLAGAVARAASGSALRLYVLVCGLCAGLTATVSLDGAVVLMVPLLVILTRSSRELLRPLLLATVGVANAFSLAVPQGNPTNVAVGERLGLPPAALVTHLFAPALVATLVCVGLVAGVEWRALRARHRHDERTRGPLSAGEKLAAAALGAAAVASAAAPWLGAAPWWVLGGVAALTLAGALLLREPAPMPTVPWRLSMQIAALVVVFDPLAGALHPLGGLASLGALVVVALAAAACAGAANNLPASVVLAGALGPGGLMPYAALAGLSVGALATPHGSVATLIAFDRAGCPAERYLRLWLPVATAATVAAVVALWLLGR
jgi:arsenical pump membrane protein